ncbi:hypothetical protein E2C01_083636 [Portunus trituberculatus]|uniref:Uncharacterized protein n=1 Tax=Portunus trituberculatus TaxID=210409 RepID=A0A5B7J5E3_PORTR|nr:hypothetical protein [Portunus trituberculatus]
MDPSETPTGPWSVSWTRGHNLQCLPRPSGCPPRPQNPTPAPSSLRTVLLHCQYF